MFARNDADLALVDLSPNITDLAEEIESEARARGQSIHVTAHECDVTIKSNVDEIFREIKLKHTKHKAANVIVNSAGIAINKSFIEISEADYDRLVAINVKGTYLVTHAALNALVSEFPNFKFENDIQTYASIINFSAMIARTGMQGMSINSLTKSSILGFTQSLAKELATYRVRVNSVLPYFVETPMTMNQINEAKERILKAACPIGRLSKPEEIGQAILFLASDQSSYVSGGSYEISGGFNYFD